MFPSAWQTVTTFFLHVTKLTCPVELSATELTSRISALRVMSCSACPVQPRAVGCSIALDFKPGSTSWPPRPDVLLLNGRILPCSPNIPTPATFPPSRVCNSRSRRDLTVRQALDLAAQSHGGHEGLHCAARIRTFSRPR